MSKVVFKDCQLDSYLPHGTVDNNLGLDRLAGPKTLDPNQI